MTGTKWGWIFYEEVRFAEMQNRTKQPMGLYLALNFRILIALRDSEKARGSIYLHNPTLSGSQLVSRQGGGGVPRLSENSAPHPTYSVFKIRWLCNSECLNQPGLGDGVRRLRGPQDRWCLCGALPGWRRVPSNAGWLGSRVTRWWLDFEGKRLDLDVEANGGSLGFFGVVQPFWGR